MIFAVCAVLQSLRDTHRILSCIQGHSAVYFKWGILRCVALLLNEKFQKAHSRWVFIYLLRDCTCRSPWLIPAGSVMHTYTYSRTVLYVVCRIADRYTQSKCWIANGSDSWYVRLWSTNLPKFTCRCDLFLRIHIICEFCLNVGSLQVNKETCSVQSVVFLHWY